MLTREKNAKIPPKMKRSNKIDYDLILKVLNKSVKRQVLMRPRVVAGNLYCEGCGVKLNSDFRYCPYCGQNVGDEDE